MNQFTRREFVQATAASAAGAYLMCDPEVVRADDKKPLYDISLGEYSLHRALRSKKLDHLDFASHTKDKFGIDAVEYWSRPFQSKAKDAKYLAELKKRAGDSGVKSLLILVDGEGNLGAPDEKKRAQAVDNHKKWVDAGKTLGCHSIRVNARSAGKYDDQLKLAADGLRRLSEYAKPAGLNVIVENHGGLSSNGEWLAKVMKAVALDNCGTLPDFGNFHGYDRYKGVTETMPFAKAVSAKSHEFDDKGNETKTDYVRMMKIVVDAGYNGYVGIEYEGRKHSEPEGIMLTKKLLERVRDQLSKKA